MRAGSAGLIGAFAANRPYLSIGVLAAGLITLAVVGARQAGGGAGDKIAALAAAGFYLIILPMALASAAPRRLAMRILFLVLTAVVAAGLVALDAGLLALPLDAPTPPRSMTLAAFALFAFYVALSPLAQNVARLGVLAPFSAVLGAAGAAGYLALAGVMASEDGALAVAISLTLGVGAGVNVAANFARRFAAGDRRKRAAAAAGHDAVAPSVFSLLALAIFFVVHSFKTNFGAVDWGLVWAGITVSAGAVATGLVAVTGGLSLSAVGEQAAVDENRRRQWFIARWRPFRLLLPATTASAAAAIVGIFVVIALFETGLSEPLRFIIYLVLLWAAAATAFVSIRTSALIAALAASSAILADYALAVASVSAPAPGDRLAALTLTAVALGAMTVSWRDAGEEWRNARDIVENALSDGLRRFLFIIGSGAASIFTAMQVFPWEGGAATVIYFLTTSLIALALAPAAMTAMSARFRN